MLYHPPRLQEALYEHLPVKSIKFEVYHHFYGLYAIPPEIFTFIIGFSCTEWTKMGPYELIS